jgi:predicted transcriptional regulator
MHEENAIIKSNEVYSNDILEKIFLELASATRCAILLKLSNSPMRLSSIARELNISIQDAHRNMMRLVNAGIVVKNPDSKFTLTEYGRLIVNELSYFRFLSSLKALMGRYTLSHLPRRFMIRLGELTNCKIINGVSSVLEKLKMLESNAREYLNIIVAQAWYDEGNIILDLVEKGVDIRIILTGRTLFPKEIFESDIVKRIHYHDKKGNIKSRFIDHTAVALYISETQAGIIPLTHDMNFDMNVLFISNDESFHTFCSDIFNYYWHRSSILDTNKINVIE